MTGWYVLRDITARGKDHAHQSPNSLLILVVRPPQRRILMKARHARLEHLAQIVPAADFPVQT